MRLLKLRNPWGQGEWTGDWSDNSDKWTPQLRELCGSSIADDGFFYIALEDYWEEYCSTSICAEQDESKYHHSQEMVDFNENAEKEYQVFLRFTLKSDVKFKQSVFSVSVF